MKYSVILTAFAFMFFSCNDNASETTGVTDTTANSQTDTSSQSASQPTNPPGELMSAMNSMMQDMKSMQMTGDPDHDFAMMMVRHHRGGIDMANVEISSGADNELKQIAQKIVSESQKEISELENFMSSHKGSKKSGFSEKAMAMMEKSEGTHSMSGSLDKDFASMMIQHHKDGVEMAKEYLKTGDAAKTKEIASGIVTKQPKDIEKLQNWLNKN